MENFFGLEVEYETIRLYQKMTNNYSRLQDNSVFIPAIVHYMFPCEVFDKNLFQTVKLERSVIAYAFEYYAGVISKNKKEWIGTNIRGEEYSKADYKDEERHLNEFLQQILEFINILKLSEVEYKAYIKALTIFNILKQIEHCERCYVYQKNDILDEEKKCRSAIMEDFYDMPNMEGVEECPITLQKIKKMYITKCGHKFEKEAIQEHLKNDSRCPLCRTIL